jgi:uncharacterized protein (TIGR02302 family)
LNERPERKETLVPLPSGRLALAWGALAWERLWPALWPLIGVAAVFSSLAFLDFLPDLPIWMHVGVLVAFVLALAWALWRGFSDIAAPDRLAARRRLERDNNLDHRPLAALEDQIASGKADPFAEALWQEHRRRLMARLKRLKVALPSPGSARRDPLAFRLPLLLLLIGALAAGWGDLLPRLERAAVPSASNRGPAEIQAMEFWITPPEYTGIAPIFVRAGDAKPEPGKADAKTTAAAKNTGVAPAAQKDAKLDEPQKISVPKGSKLLIQLHGRLGAPRLKLGEIETPFAVVDETTHRLETVLEQGGRLSVEGSRRNFGAWVLDVVADKPPTVAFGQPPQRTSRGALRLEYDAKDDYGVAGVKAVIRLLGEDEALRAGEDPIELEMPLPGLRLKEAKAAGFHDLTAHIWAGLKVEIRFIVTDEPGQTGESPPVQTVLPERAFNHPVARAIIEQRRMLSLAPEKRREVAAALFAPGAAPAALFRRPGCVHGVEDLPGPADARPHHRGHARGAGIAVGHGAAHRGRQGVAGRARAARGRAAADGGAQQERLGPGNREAHQRTPAGAQTST